MARPLMVRPECFGATVFDPETLAYFFINRDQFAQLMWRLGYSDQDNPGVAAVGMTNEPSGGRFAELVAAGGKVTTRTAPPPLPLDTLARRYGSISS